MTNEIKEILDRFYDEYPKEIRILEKYITNLQENHCDYKEKCNEYNVGCIKEILCNYQKANNNLQQRIDKAVEYIDSFCLEEDGYVGYGDDLTPKELINILRGVE